MYPLNRANWYRSSHSGNIRFYPLRQRKRGIDFLSRLASARLVSSDRRNLFARPPSLSGKSPSRSKEPPTRYSFKDSQSKETHSASRFNPPSRDLLYRSPLGTTRERPSSKLSSICKLANFPCKTNSDISQQRAVVTVATDYIRPARNGLLSPWRYLRPRHARYVKPQNVSFHESTSR